MKSLNVSVPLRCSDAAEIFILLIMILGGRGGHFNPLGNGFSHEFELHPHSKTAAFKSPACFTQGSDHNYIYSTLADSYNALLSHATEKADRGIAFIAQHGTATHVAAPLKNFDLVLDKPVESGELNELADKSFDLVASFTPYVEVQRAWSLSTLIEASPTLGLPRFITISKGYAIVMLFDISTVIDSGLTVETFSEFLIRQDQAFFSRVRSFGLQEGHSCWCPAGFTAVVVGVGPSSQAKEQKEKFDHCAYIVQPLLDKKSFMEVSYPVRIEIVQWLTKAVARNLKIFGGDAGPNVKKFLKVITRESEKDKPASPVLSPEKED
jgi:hypothetical protein